MYKKKNYKVAIVMGAVILQQFAILTGVVVQWLLQKNYDAFVTCRIVNSRKIVFVPIYMKDRHGRKRFREPKYSVLAIFH